jgi:GDP/UDP-N,N'-diacetylbacillosamine 2-epimerase (hydrolysing)
MRRICYISGTRADFGLMRSTLQAIRDHPALSLEVIATGMHLSPAYGETVREIEAAGLEVSARVPVPLEPATGATMARNIGHMTGAFVDAMEARRPDIVLLLGDRGEMLAGAMAGIHLGLPVAHVHGGERSGTVDESVRHAISKLSHLHFPATEESRQRLIRMGEMAGHIHVSGAPGLDGLTGRVAFDRTAIMTGFGLDPDRPFALMIFHPVLQETASAEADTTAQIAALTAAGLQILALKPNSDGGSDSIRAALVASGKTPGLQVITHLGREDFLAAMATAGLMIGNSSAGIIEAASFGTPVINVGSRQNLRERNANTMDTTADPAALDIAIRAQLAHGRYPAFNVYGDGQAGRRIAGVLADKTIDNTLMHKVNGY